MWKDRDCSPSSKPAKRASCSPAAEAELRRPLHLLKFLKRALGVQICRVLCGDEDRYLRGDGKVCAKGFLVSRWNEVTRQLVSDSRRLASDLALPGQIHLSICWFGRPFAYLWWKESRRILWTVDDAGMSIPDSGASQKRHRLGPRKLRLCPWASQGY